MTDSVKRYQITYTVCLDLIIDPAFPRETVATPSLASQVAATVGERIEQLKAVLPEEVQAWFGGVGAYRVQQSPGRVLLQDFQLHCEEKQEVA